MPNERIHEIWPEWTVENVLGEGSYGTVYQVVRRDQIETRAAVKVISIPSRQSEVDSLRSEGFSIEGTRTYLKGIVDDFVNEIQLMDTLKGVPNIVGVEDYKVVEKQDQIGWDIYIRMELLTPFSEYQQTNVISEADSIKIGIDICTALEICAQRNIIHRDIKPANIFRNGFGDFKLGDFGIARKLDNMTSGLSGKGTPEYMAPEIVNKPDYDARVDIYSLGIVLYRLLNKNRLPFLDSETQILNPIARKHAVDRRIDGELFPAPSEASPAMAHLIMRACAYNPDQRFSNATEMKIALESVKAGTYFLTATDMERTTSVRKAPEKDFEGTKTVRHAPQAQTNLKDKTGQFGKRKSKALVVIISLLVCAMFVTGGIIYVPKLIEIIPIVRVFEEFGEVDGSSEANDTSTIDISDSSKVLKNEALSTASIQAAEGDFIAAARTLEATLSQIGYDDELITVRDDYYSTFESSVIEEADEMAKTEDYEGAIKRIQFGLEEYSDSEVFSTKLDEYDQKLALKNKAQIMAIAEDYASKKDYLKAYKVIEDYTKDNKEDPDLGNKANEYEEKYIKMTIDSAKKYVADENYEESIILLNDALREFPENKEINDFLHETELSAPVLLSTLTVSDSSYYKQIQGDIPVKDTVGNTYETNNLFALDESNGYYTFYNQAFATYYIGGEYQKLTLSLAVSDAGGNTSSCITIYGDESKTLYTSGITGRVFAPEKLSIEVSDVKWITFRISDNQPREHIVWLIADAKLYKESTNMSKSVENEVKDTPINNVGDEIVDVCINNLAPSCYLSEIQPTLFERYEGNVGDTCVFNLKKDGLPGLDNLYYRNGNVGMDGELYENGFEVWMARWNDKAEKSWVRTQYELDKAYSVLSGVTGLINSPNKDNFDTTVYFLDGDRLLSSYRLLPNNYKQNIYVDVAGVQTLTLFVEDNVAVKGGTSFALAELLLSDLQYNTEYVDNLEDILDNANEPSKIIKIQGDVIGSQIGYGNNSSAGAKAAFDGDPGTFFDPVSKGEGYCGLSMSESYILTEVRVLSRYQSEDRLKGAMIQGSNDGMSWSTLCVFNERGSNDIFTTRSEFINNVGYTMFRYYNQENHGDVAEIEFYGYIGKKETYDTPEYKLKGVVIGSAIGWSNDPSVGAKAAFDGNPETYFDPIAKGEGYCGLELDGKYILTAVKILSRKNWEERLNGATIRGSNDGNNWTEVCRFTGKGNSNSFNTYYDFVNNTGYSMYCYYNDQEHGDVAEIEFYGIKQ